MVSFSHMVQQGGQPRNPENEASRDPGRLLILCFDGTGNKFGEVCQHLLSASFMPNLFAESTRI